MAAIATSAKDDDDPVATWTYFDGVRLAWSDGSLLVSVAG